MKIIIGSVVLGVAILMIGATTEGKAWISDSDKAALNYNTNGIHVWLLRPNQNTSLQQEICLNEKSPFTIMKQHQWETEKQNFNHKNTSHLNFSDNPWPLLCSTPIDQEHDYYTKYRAWYR